MATKRLKSSLLSLKQLSEAIKNGDISPVDLVEICLDRIKKLDPILNAFITVIDEGTLYQQSEIAEKEIKHGRYHSPLHGIPFSIKDIFYAKGVRCTAGSKIFSNYIPSVDATAVKRLKKAGAILIGTNNLNEFASGITGLNYFYAAYTRRIVEKSNSIQRMRIGVPRKYFFDHVYPQIESLFYDFIESLRSAGSIEVYDLDIHHTEKYQRTWQNIRLAEASEIHIKWLKTRPRDYSHEVRQMLTQGTKISAVDYISAINTIGKIRREFLSILNSKVDVIMVPTTIISAPQFDEETIKIDKNIVLETREALLQNTILFNAIGLPAISIPIGLTRGKKMPVGAQIIGPPFMEETILSIAYYHENTNNSSKMFLPPILSK